jgi:hypothetical protein
VLGQCISEISDESKKKYTCGVERGVLDSPEVFLVLVKTGRKSCFHLAVTGTNADIENAKMVCAQAVLCRTEEHDPAVYFAVYDTRAYVVYFCRFIPSQQELEDVSSYSMRKEANQVGQWLKTYIVVNASVRSLAKRATQLVDAVCVNS